MLITKQSKNKKENLHFINVNVMTSSYGLKF